jgi:predicted DNA-binding protein (UPF0251 family)
VFRFGLRLVRDEQVVEDLFDEVFLEGGTRPGNLKAGLPRSPSRICPTFPEVTVRKKGTSNSLCQSLVHLTVEHREIADLVDCHEKSAEEIAGLIGIPENTVKTYARKNLTELQGSRHGARLAMMAAGNEIVSQEPGEIALLLPWYATGTLSLRDARRVKEALARDTELARQYAIIREEYSGTIDLNESSGTPSVRAMQTLFAAIDAEPARKPGAH